MHSTRHSSNSLFSYFLLTTSLLSIVYAQNTYQGCYALDTNLVVNDTSIYQSTGRCSGEICGKNNYAVFGLTSGSQCWCGNEIPGDQVTPDHCNLQCPGYPADNCNIPHKTNQTDPRRRSRISQCLVNWIGKTSGRSSDRYPYRHDH